MATDTTLLQWIESALASHLQEDAPNHDHSYTQQHEADDSSANFISTSTAYLELISSIRSMSDPIEIKQLCTVLIGCLGTIALHSNRFQDPDLDPTKLGPRTTANLAKILRWIF